MKIYTYDCVDYGFAQDERLAYTDIPCLTGYRTRKEARKAAESEFRNQLFEHCVDCNAVSEPDKDAEELLEKFDKGEWKPTWEKREELGQTWLSFVNPNYEDEVWRIFTITIED